MIAGCFGPCTKISRRIFNSKMCVCYSEDILNLRDDFLCQDICSLLPPQADAPRMCRLASPQAASRRLLRSDQSRSLSCLSRIRYHCPGIVVSRPLRRYRDRPSNRPKGIALSSPPQLDGCRSVLDRRDALSSCVSFVLPKVIALFLDRPPVARVRTSRDSGYCAGRNRHIPPPAVGGGFQRIRPRCRRNARPASAFVRTSPVLKSVGTILSST